MTSCSGRQRGGEGRSGLPRRWGGATRVASKVEDAEAVDLEGSGGRDSGGHQGEEGRGSGDVPREDGRMRRRMSRGGEHATAAAIKWRKVAVAADLEEMGVCSDGGP